jgi:hypothetical protein
MLVGTEANMTPAAAAMGGVEARPVPIDWQLVRSSVLAFSCVLVLLAWLWFRCELPALRASGFAGHASRHFRRTRFLSVLLAAQAFHMGVLALVAAGVIRGDGWILAGRDLQRAAEGVGIEIFAIVGHGVSWLSIVWIVCLFAWVRNFFEKRSRLPLFREMLLTASAPRDYARPFFWMLFGVLAACTLTREAFAFAILKRDIPAVTRWWMFPAQAGFRVALLFALLAFLFNDGARHIGRTRSIIVTAAAMTAFWFAAGICCMILEGSVFDSSLVSLTPGFFSGGGWYGRTLTQDQTLTAQLTLQWSAMGTLLAAAGLAFYLRFLDADTWRWHAKEDR